MKINRDCFRLYAITDRSLLRGESLCSQVEKALKGGATFIQLREKNISYEQFVNEAIDIRKLCREYNVPFVINDNVEVASKVDADGVHIGQNDAEICYARKILGNNKIIGVTAKTVLQATEAEKNGADYLGAGAVFGSKTKADAAPMEHTTLKKICRTVSIPVVAIGGIDKDNVYMLKDAGIAGVAVIRGIFAADDITEEARNILKKINGIIS